MKKFATSLMLTTLFISAYNSSQATHSTSLGSHVEMGNPVDGKSHNLHPEYTGNDEIIGSWKFLTYEITTIPERATPEQVERTKEALAAMYNESTMTFGKDGSYQSVMNNPYKEGAKKEISATYRIDGDMLVFEFPEEEGRGSSNRFEIDGDRLNIFMEQAGMVVKITMKRD